MTDSPHNDLLVATLAGHQQDFANRTWQEIIAAADRALVLTGLRGALQELEAAAQLRDEVAGFLAEVANLNRERNEDILSELTSIAAILSREGIQPVALKRAAYLLS